MTKRYSVGGLMKDQVFDGSEFLAQCPGSEAAHWLVDKLNRAERLAEAVGNQCDAGLYVGAEIREALAAFRSFEPQPAKYVGSAPHEYSGRMNPIYKLNMNRRIERPAADSEPHPDTVRLEDAQKAIRWLDDRGNHPPAASATWPADVLEAIDAAREGESE